MDAKIYRMAGIGSAKGWTELPRESRDLYCRVIGASIERLQQNGYTVQFTTGAAKGADQAGAEVALACGASLELFLPSAFHEVEWWSTMDKRYPGMVKTRTYNPATDPEWTASIDRLHPNPGALRSDFVRSLMARNWGILMAPKVQMCCALPSSAPAGGGTGQGIRICVEQNILCYNLSYEAQDLRRPNEIGAALARQRIGDYELPWNRPKVAVSDWIDIWTDGGCSRNPGPMGAGIVAKFILDGQVVQREWSIPLGQGTNQQAELRAVIEALLKVKNRSTARVRLHADSAYTLGFIDPSITKPWKAKSNVELVAQLRQLVGELAAFEVVKLKGHAGHEENERADQLATQACAAN